MKAASRSRRKAWSSSSVAAAPGVSCTTAPTSSPSTSWGMPMTAASVDGRVLEQRGLDLGAVDVLAAADDHVLGPVDDVDEALVVDAGRCRRCGASRR